MTRSPSRGRSPQYGFDHAVIAVRDLPEAVKRYTALGFNVEPGGVHPGFGTSNALVQLENGYIELLAVEDAKVARRAGIRRREVVEYLERRAGGLIGYAISCDSLERIRLRAGRADPTLAVQPLEMSRIRPDSSTLRWRLLVPGESTWCRPWPFLIEWAGSERPSVRSAQADHPNGAFAIDALVVGTTSLDRVSAFFDENLGLPVRRIAGQEGDDRSALVVEAGGCRVEFVEIAGGAAPGPIASTLEGEGPVELRIRVSSLGAASELLGSRGVGLVSRGAHLNAIEPDAAAGARLALVGT